MENLEFDHTKTTIWGVYKTRQKTKTKWLNYWYPNFKIFGMQPLILVQLCVFFQSGAAIVFCTLLFIKKVSEVICKDKVYVLRRATYPKSYFWLDKSLLRYRAANGFYCFCDNRFCLASPVWTRSNYTGCLIKKDTPLFQYGVFNCQKNSSNL